MPIFSFKALTSNGGIETGEIDASDRAQALRNLERKGLQPVRVVQDAAAGSGATAKRGENKKDKSKIGGAAGRRGRAKAAEAELSDQGEAIKLKRSEVLMFTEELADMLGAGLQLEPALRSMENRQESGNLKIVSTRIRQLVRDGNSFSFALRKVSPSFGPLYCSLAAAGEASGALDTILVRQVHYLKTIQELQNKIILAMIYPAFLISVGFGVSVIFVTQLIPQLIGLIEKTPGSEVPVGVKVLMGVTDFFREWGVVVLLIILAAAFLFKAWKDKEENKPVWDETKLQIPIVGRVVETRFYVQFLETMSNLLGNGLPLLRALELSRDATGNLYLRSAMDRVIDLVGDGRSLSRSMIQSGTFPPVLIDMVSVGEQTGRLDHALARAAQRYDKELGNAIARITALIMPTVLITLASLVGTMAYLMITAIFQTISNMGGGGM